MREREPIELTTKPVDSTLNLRGNIFMPEPGSGEIPQAPSEIKDSPENKKGNIGRAVSERENTARQALRNLVAPGEDASIEERSSYELIKRELLEMAGRPAIAGGAEDRTEKMTPAEMAKEIRDSLNELPSTERQKYLARLEEAKSLGPKEKEDLLREMVNAIDSQINDVTRIIDETIRNSRISQSESEDAIGPGSSRDEVYKEINKSHKVKIDTLASSIKQGISRLSDSEEKNEEVIGELLNDEALFSWVGTLAIDNEDDSSLRVREQIGDVMSSKDSIEDKKARLSQIVDSISQRYIARKEKRPEDPYNPVDSIQDLAKWISASQGADLWGENGQYPILDKEGKFHGENMILWVREQTNKMHVDNRNDAISPLGSIHVKIGISPVSLYEMVRIDRQRFMKDEETGAVLDDLAEELIIEAWGFGQVRNFDLAYNQQMRDDKKLPEAIGQIHARNDLTNGTTFRELMQMPDVFGKDAKVGRAVMFANDFYYNLSDWEVLVGILGGEKAAAEFPKRLSEFRASEADTVAKIDKKLLAEGFNKDTKASEKEYKREFGERYGLEIVNAIGDIETFTKVDFRNALRIIQNKTDWEGEEKDNKLESFEGFYDAKDPDRFYVTETQADTGEKIQHDLFDSQGRFNIATFVKYMNIYNYANPEQSMLALTKELVRQKAAQKFGLKAGVESDKTLAERKKQKFAELVKEQISIGRTELQARNEAKRQIFGIERRAERINLEFAEHLAYAFQRPYGGAARNDVNRRGFNALAKLNMEDYLTRQSAANRAGPVGIREAVGIYRNLGPDMWTALRTESRQSPNEIFKDVRNIENTSLGELIAKYKDGLSEKEKAEFSDKSPEEQRDILREKAVKDEVKGLKFADGAEADVASNVQGRGFQIFHAQTGGDRMDLNKAVTWDPFTGVKIDTPYVEEHVNDGMIKPARYFGSTNGANKFSSETRRLTKVVDGLPVYEDTTLAESSYSPEIIREMVLYNGGRIAGERVSIDANGKVDLTNLSQEQKDYLDYGDGRLLMVKVGLALDFGALLAHHRKLRGHAQRWGWVKNEAFFGMLEAMEEMEPDPNNPGRERTKLDENGQPLRFFDDKLMNLMRKRGGVKSWKLLLEDAGLQAGGPLALSILEMIMKFSQGIVK